MEEKKNKFLIKSYKQMFLVIGIFTLVLLVGGTTYAFFNYTRTGSANTLRTGRIYFSTEQTNQNTITLNNIFPMTKEQALADTSTNGTLVVTFTGDTTYTEGIEYLLTIDEVSRTANVPISLIMDVNVTSTPEGSSPVALTENSNYYTAREAKTTSMYKVEGEDTTINSTNHKIITDIETGKYLLAGYIKSGTDVVNGTVTIKAFIDADNLLITDTPVDQSQRPSTAYTDGTDTTGKTVISTTDWNSLQSTGVSFKVKGEANPGIWVPEPSQGTIDSCPGCKFIYSTDDMWATWNTESETPTQITSGYSENYNDIVTSSGKNYFLGVVTNNNNEVTNVYACGVKDGTPFCIEGTSDGNKYTANQGLINGANLWNNTCSLHPDSETGYGYDEVQCGPWDNTSVSASLDSDGFVNAGVRSSGDCHADSSGYFTCIEFSGEGGE